MKFSNNQHSNQQGVVPVTLLVAAIALVGFIVLSSTAGFKDKLFATLFPKPLSHASTTSSIPTIDDFKTPYSTLLNRLVTPNRIQLFGGGLVMSEFDDGSGNIYAGHLGPFWSPPYFSSFGGNGVSGGTIPTGSTSPLWRNGFNVGTVIYNYTYGTYGAGAPESPSDKNTEAFWYPSKMVMSKFYAGGNSTSPCSGQSQTGGSVLKGVKAALPGVRGLGLKLTLTQCQDTPQKMGLAFLASVPTLQTLTSWPTPSNPTSTGWNWTQPASTSNSTASYFDSANNMIVVSDTANGTYMALGLSQPIDSWGLDNNYSGNSYNLNLYNNFVSTNHGSFDRGTIYTDNNGNGSTIGLSAKSSSALNFGQSFTVSLIIGLGSSPDEAENIVKTYQGTDIESAADNYWNSKLASAFNNVGTFSSGDPTLNKIYQNSIFSYLINRWDTYNTLGEAAGFGQSIGLFPWLTGDAGVLSMADPPFWKAQLINLLGLDYTKCRAYDPLINLCDKTYSYSIPSLIDAVYRYVANTSDDAFLSQTITIYNSE